MKPTDFIVEHNPFIAQDANEMHGDHEVQMARADCYNAADYAIKLHKILQGIKETGQLEGWVSEKITLANDYLRTVYEYLSYENREQESGAMPAFAYESADQRFEEVVAESASVGASTAGGMAIGAVGSATPVQRRIRQESAATKKYGNAMKTKQPKIGKGVY
jgi:hypothetical protein